MPELPDVETIVRCLSGQRGMLKALLLRQDFIAGLGNIYADGVLFQAGLSPLRRVEELRL